MQFFLIQLAIILIFSILLSVQDFLKKEVNKTLISCSILIQATWLFVKVNLLHRNPDYLFNQFLSAVILMVFYYLVLFISKKKLGFGDVLFGIFCGLCLNLKVLWISIAIEVIIFFIFIIIIKIKDKKIAIKEIKLPFIPFMAVSLVITYLLQEFAFKL